MTSLWLHVINLFTHLKAELNKKFDLTSEEQISWNFSIYILCRVWLESPLIRQHIQENILWVYFKDLSTNDISFNGVLLLLIWSFRSLYLNRRLCKVLHYWPPKLFMVVLSQPGLVLWCILPLFLISIWVILVCIFLATCYVQMPQFSQLFIMQCSIYFITDICISCILPKKWKRVVMC